MSQLKFSVFISEILEILKKEKQYKNSRVNNRWISGAFGWWMFHIFITTYNPFLLDIRCCPWPLSPFQLQIGFLITMIKMKMVKVVEVDVWILSLQEHIFQLDSHSFVLVLFIRIFPVVRKLLLVNFIRLFIVKLM